MDEMINYFEEERRILASVERASFPSEISKMLFAQEATLARLSACYKTLIDQLSYFPEEVEQRENRLRELMKEATALISQDISRAAEDSVL